MIRCIGCYREFEDSKAFDKHAAQRACGTDEDLRLAGLALFGNIWRSRAPHGQGGRIRTDDRRRKRSYGLA